jgi:hypothetical protein
LPLKVNTWLLPILNAPFVSVSAVAIWMEEFMATPFVLLMVNVPKSTMLEGINTLLDEPPNDKP